jgi:hypothetical protein
MHPVELVWLVLGLHRALGLLHAVLQVDRFTLGSGAEQKNRNPLKQIERVSE